MWHTTLTSRQWQTAGMLLSTPVLHGDQAGGSRPSAQSDESAAASKVPLGRVQSLPWLPEPRPATPTEEGMKARQQETGKP